MAGDKIKLSHLMEGLYTVESAFEKLLLTVRFWWEKQMAGVSNIVDLTRPM